MFTDLLKKVIARKDLTEDEAAEVVDAILSGELQNTQIAGILTALATKGETYEELAGAAKNDVRTSRWVDDSH